MENTQLSIHVYQVSWLYHDKRMPDRSYV